MPSGGLPAGAAVGGVLGGVAVSPMVVGVATSAVHAAFDRILAQVSALEVGVVISSADVQEADRVVRRAEAVRSALVAAADRQQVHRQWGHSSTSAWMAAATRSGGAAAQQEVVLATALAGGLDRTREAFESGRVSKRNAGIIVKAMDKLPEGVTLADREKVESALVRDAAHMNPGLLDRAAKVALAAAEKTAAEVADHLEQQLLDEERRAYRSSTVTLRDLGNGTTELRALLPTTVAGVLRKVLQTMTAPRRDHLRKAAEKALADGQTLAGCLDDGSVAADLLGSTGTHKHPSFGTGANRASGANGAGVEGRNADWADIDWAHRRGRALTELIEHLDTERLTGKVASTVIVTMTAEQVLGAARAAELQATVHELTGTLLELSPSSAAASTDTGHLLSASAARRIACQADIIPAVLGGPSQILDLGRQNRFFNDHQRTALATIYETCAAEDCDRPYAWSELHHEDPWSKGGLTDLDRAIPLCGYHHRKIHDPGYHHEITRDGNAHGHAQERGAKTVHFRLRSEVAPR
jgi:hypothetical protein